MIFLRLFDTYEGTIQDIPLHEDVAVDKGDTVIYKNEEEEEAMATIIRRFTIEKEFPHSKGVFLRKATAHDMQKIESLVDKSKRALEQFSAKVQQHNMFMKPVSCQYSFNNKNIHFTFTASERVDFRELLKDIIATFKKKIFLEQIGPRDRARLLGGFGKCGQQLCCTTFLRELPSVTMENVRQQHLIYKSSSKLLGSCGKLLCCITYELDVYKELGDGFPSMGSIVEVKKERARVIGLDILNQILRVQFEKDDTTKTVALKEIKVLEERKKEDHLETEERLSEAVEV